MKTWEKYKLKPYSKANPKGVFALLQFDVGNGGGFMVRKDESIVAEANFEDIFEMAIEAGTQNIVKDTKEGSTYGPRPPGYPKTGFVWFIDEDSREI